MPRDTAIIDFSNAETKRLLLAHIRTLSGLHRVSIHKCQKQRSLSQNSFYWSCVLPTIARGMADVWGERVSAEDAHEFLKVRFLSRPVVDRITGEVMGQIPGSTANLSISEFAEYLDQLIKFAAEQLQIEIALPSEYAEVG